MDENDCGPKLSVDIRYLVDQTFWKLQFYMLYALHNTCYSAQNNQITYKWIHISFIWRERIAWDCAVLSLTPESSSLWKQEYPDPIRNRMGEIFIMGNSWDLYRSPDTVCFLKTTRLRWAGHVDRIVLIRKINRQNTPSEIWTNLAEIRIKRINWIYLPEHSTQWRAFLNAVFHKLQSEWIIISYTLYFFCVCLGYHLGRKSPTSLCT